MIGVFITMFEANKAYLHKIIQKLLDNKQQISLYQFRK